MALHFHVTPPSPCTISHLFPCGSYLMWTAPLFYGIWHNTLSSKMDLSTFFFPGNIPAYFSFLLKNSSCPVCLSPPPIWCPPHPKTIPLCNISSTGAPAQASWTLSCLDSRRVLAGQLRVLAGQAAENDYVPQFRHPHCSGGLSAVRQTIEIV